jgi:TonB-linked SusC/RagA family outer membrane protein
MVTLFEDLKIKKRFENMKHFKQKIGRLTLGILAYLYIGILPAWTQVGSETFARSPFADVNKALYGKIAGLNVYQGAGSSYDNAASLSLHGRTPLVLIDGFIRSMSDLTTLEIDTCYALTDAAALVLYGVRGGNGALLFKTKRSKADRLSVTAQYYLGLNTQFRAPQFADAYPYGMAVNQALANDGLGARYNTNELEALRTGSDPVNFPNVNWWNETLNRTGLTHNLKLTFDGGWGKFSFYTVIDYYRDRSMLKENTEDDRYDTTPTDTRLSVRTNIDVEISETTRFRVGLRGKLQEVRSTRYGRSDIMSPIWSTPSAAFPIKYPNGMWGGNATYGSNPVALLTDYGHTRSTYGNVLADFTLTQQLDMILSGLSIELAGSFDNNGSMAETSSKSYQYMSSYPHIDNYGTLVTQPVTYGAISEVLGHSTPFESMMLRNEFRAQLAWNRVFGLHHLDAALVYDQMKQIRQNRNNTYKNQHYAASLGYTYAGRYALNVAASRSGSIYLPDGDKYANYSAVSAHWMVSNETWMQNTPINLLKIKASYGATGYDGNLSHELWRQYWGSSGSYYFGAGAAAATGNGEGSLPVIGLVVERVKRATAGLDFAAFNNRFDGSLNVYNERRENALVNGANAVSSVIGIGVGQTCAGEYNYRGIDVSLGWNGKVGKLDYRLGGRISYLETEIINDGQGYQEFDYLYTKGNAIGQRYGLEAIGFFQDQQEINNSPEQLFSTVRPGDIKYRDQNNDNVIDGQDVVSMYGSSVPRIYFGFDLGLSYGRWELSADFQGLTGRTLYLLDSPLYKPLVSNANISSTFLNRETPWTPDHKGDATMPRLTTLANDNNYRPSSLWYRDGSFIKLRNLLLSYTFPKRVTRLADVQLFVQGTNLFSLDNLNFTDPEQLAANYPSVRTYWAGIKLNF